MATNEASAEGIHSLLDTDLYKLTMQSAVLKYFPDVVVTYAFTNRTPDMKLNRAAFHWLESQISKLGSIVVSPEEIAYLRDTCPYLSKQYLQYLQTFKLRPKEHIMTRFVADIDTGNLDDLGQVEIHIEGPWLETILYEIPLLALTSEAYFKFCDKDWTYKGQEDSAYLKGLQLLEHGCLTSEFGSRRRRDYHTQELAIKGLMRANEEGGKRDYPGKITGTSNVHFAMRFGIPPIGTVAHEWFMGVAAVTNSYQNATEAALSHWIGTFGKGVLGIALTDTFGTPAFLKAFSNPLPNTPHTSDYKQETYADVFTGIRQDSGDPLEFVKTMRNFYDVQGITAKKTIVFSDSLNVERCIEYKNAAAQAGFTASFGVGTFFTNDFTNTTTGNKSKPLNIVIKLSSANGRPAVKISDNMGKNTGDEATVKEVKEQLGYTEQEWQGGGDERTRWGA